MSLATRCTACGTAFRVVQDQLRVSEGWVRCGQCREVFNALEQLFDLERDGAPVTTAAAADAAALTTEAAPRVAVEAELPSPVAEHDAATAAAAAVESAASNEPAGAVPATMPVMPVVQIEVAPPQPSSAPVEPPMATMALSAMPDERALEPERLPHDAPALEEERLPDDAAALEREPVPHDEPLDGDGAAGIALVPESIDDRDDDDSPLLPALDTHESADVAPATLVSAASFLARELDADGDDTIRLPDPLTARTDAGSAPDPDVAVDEWAVEAAHDRPSLVGKEIDAHLFGKRRHARRHAPVAHVSARDQIDFSDARFDSNILTEDEALDGNPEAAESAMPEPLAGTELAVTPGFLRRAEHRARWQRPLVRVALGSAAAGLAIVLAVQAGHHFRDDVAAASPGLKPVLATWCALAACKLEAPRHIDDITVESTALARASTDAFRLAVTLRNHSAVALALPAIDLSLTDAGGRLVSRRALTARDFKVASAVLPPKGEIVLEAPIAARNTRVSGYTVEIFYP